MITCGECMSFTRDQIGDGTGIGTCSIYEANKVTHGNKAQHPKGRTLMPNVKRDCHRFKRK